MRKIIFFFVSVLKFSWLMAQTGPGGVGNNTTNRIWFDAQQQNLVNNASVASIVDFSGNNNNAGAPTAAKRPKFITNQSNAQPTFRFDGTDDIVRTGAISNLNTSTISWFTVMKSPTVTYTGTVMSNVYTGGAGVGSAALWGTYINTSNSQYNSSTRSGTGTSINNSLGYNSNFNFSENIWNGATDNFTSFLNGNFIASKGGASALPSGHTVTAIGGRTNSTPAYNFNGDIAEIIVFTSVVNTTERRIIENYLGNKYNITFSGDLYAYEATHQYGIAGIGQTSAADNHLDSRGTSTVRISNPSSINDGEFMFWGHNNGAVSISNSEVPPTIVTRYPREWRVTKTGDAGTVTIEFDVTTFPLPDAGRYLLMVDADGDFTNATLSSEVAAVGGMVTFTNVTLNDGDFFTLGNKGDIESITDGSWQTPATWNCTCIPALTSNVTIKNPHTVTIDGISFSRNLTIENGATLTFNTSDILSITGSFVNSGTFNAGIGITEFAGSNNQTIGGTTITTFSTIHINNGNALQLLTNSAITNQLLFTSGNFDAGVVDMTLISNASGTAQIGIVPGASTISGNFIIQRFVPGGNAYWDYLASPVQSTTLVDWDNELIMSVPNGADGTAWGTNTTLNNSVKTYNEATNTSVGIASVNSTLLPTQGFQVFLGDNLNTFASRTFDTRGIPSHGNIPKALNFTDAAHGYNLIGNPYASDVSWASLFAASTNIQNQYFIYDKTIKNFKTFVGAGTIPSSQGFMIRATAPGAQVNFSELTKVSGSATWTRPTNPNFSLNLRVTEKDNVYGGFVAVKSDINSIDELDELDGGYIENDFDEDSPNIYTQIENEKLQINSIREDDFSKQIGVFVKANRNGTLIITSDIINNSTDYSNIYLEDVENNKIVDLKNNNAYEFEITDKETRKQFVLHLNKNNTVNPLSSKNQSIGNNIIFINSSDNCGLIVSSEKPALATIVVTNMLGQEVIKTETREILEPTKVLLNLPNNSMYLVKVTIGDSVYTNKVIR
ncbi:MAG: T9SS type A sorting domain-containing protein [Bacteroidota bacterium]